MMDTTALIQRLGQMTDERRRLERMMMQLEEVTGQRDLLLAAVEAVEWIYAASGDWVYCPWCKTEWYSNIPEHWAQDDNCQREAAIAAVKEE